MSLQLQTFNEFTPAMFAAFAAKIQKDTGVAVKGDNGTVVHGSFTFTYNYDANTQVLLIQCLKKPIFINASTIINGLTEEILELKQAVLNAPVIQPAVTEPEPSNQ